MDSNNQKKSKKEELSAHIHPEYKKAHQMAAISTFPISWLIYFLIWSMILGSVVQGSVPYDGIVSDLFVVILPAILALLGAIKGFRYFSYSIWGYNQSSFKHFWDRIGFIGTTGNVVRRSVGRSAIHSILASVLSPIIGPRTLKKAIQHHKILGDARAFQWDK